MKRVLITRTKEQSEEFASRLIAHNYEPLFFPTIEITSPLSWNDADEKINAIDTYSDIIFTSTNAVHYFFTRCKTKSAFEKLSDKIFHAVGATTKQTTENAGFRIETIPEKFSAKELAEAIVHSSAAKKKIFLFPHGDLSDETLQAILKENGIAIDSIVVYRTIQPQINEDEKISIAYQLAFGLISVVTFFSPSSVQHFLEIFSECKNSSAITFAVIGETTKQACIKYGIHPSQIILIDTLFHNDFLTQQK